MYATFQTKCVIGSWTSGRSLPLLTLLAYFPFQLTIKFYQVINFFSVTRSSVSANNNRWNLHIFFSRKFLVKRLNVLSRQLLLLIFSFHRLKPRVCFRVNEIIKKQKQYASCKKLRLRWALYRKVVVNVQSPFLIFKKSTSTLLVHL